jgi:hypothetical protein
MCCFLTLLHLDVLLVVWRIRKRVRSEVFEARELNSRVKDCAWSTNTFHSDFTFISVYCRGTRISTDELQSLRSSINIFFYVFRSMQITFYFMFCLTVLLLVQTVHRRIV